MFFFSHRRLSVFISIFNIFVSFSQSGSYYGNPSDASELCGIRVQTANSFSSNIDAQKALDKIIAVTGISKRFALYQCSGINNCEAITFRGIRYIFYDPAFMKSITSSAGSWTNLSILAHEVGHHVNAHSLDWLALASGAIQPISLEQKRQQELEADEFSGFVLAKLGATLLQAQAAVKLVSDNSDDSYSTHPSKNKRLAAIEKGYNQAKGITTKPYEIITLTAEDYFYIALNANDNQVKITNYTKCLQINPNIISAYINRGYCYRADKKLSLAIDDFNKIIELAKNSSDPKSKGFLSDGYRGKGWCYSSLILYDEKNAAEYQQKAITEFTNAIRVEASSENYFARGRVYSDRLYLTEENSLERTTMSQKALNDFNAALKLTPNDTEIISARAMLYWNYIKDEISALNDFELVTKLDPKDIYALVFCGQLNYELGYYETAIPYYNNALTIYPDGLTFFRRAECYIELGKYKEAISDLTKSISISKDKTNDTWMLVDNKITEIYWARALTYEKLDNYSLAISDYTKIIELTKEEPFVYAYTRRARNYTRISRNDLALIDYNKAILIEPQNPELYNYRGYHYQFVVQNNIKAIEDYNKAINFDMYFFPAYQNRSLIHLSNKNDNLALQDLNWIINQSENPDPEVYFLRSVTNQNFKRYPEAFSDINMAISLDSEDGRYYFQRGGINKILGKEYCADYQTSCDKGWHCEEYNESCK